MSEGKNGQPRVLINPRNTSRFVVAKDPFALAKAYYAAMKGSSLRRRDEPHSDEAGFVAANPRAGFKIVLPPQRRSGLHRCGPENLRLYVFALRIGKVSFAAADQKVWETMFLPSTFKIHLAMKK